MTEASSTGAKSSNEGEENALGRAYDGRLVRRLWRYIQPYRRDFFLSLACLPVVSAFSLAQPYLLKRTIDEFVAQANPAGIASMATLFALMVVCELLALYAQYYLTMSVAQRSLADLRVDIFSKVQSLEAAFFDRNPVGRLVTRMTTDVDVINEMFAAGAMTILMDLVTLAGIIGIMLWLDWRLTVVSFSLLPFLLLAINFFRIRARTSYRSIRERIARLNSYLQEAISGMMVIQLFAREKQAWQEFDARNDAHRSANHWANIYEASLFSIVEGVGSVSFALIIWYGSGGVLSGVFAIGTLVAFIEYVQKFFVPIRDFSSKYAVMQSAMSAAERVFDLLDTPPKIVTPARSAYAPSRVEGRIELQNVWFAYKGEDYVLRDVSFRADAGEKVAIVGATGSGKTTIIKLLNRAYDVAKGRVLVDGVDVREWDLTSLRRAIGVVSQDVFLFSGSIAENIRMRRSDIGWDRMEQAARVVHADSFISKLDMGFDEPLRERGSNLSSGQRQLLSFARALAYDPAILVLDEATSSVDSETELLIQDALAQLMRARTSIAIAHRLTTIESSDRIIVMHRGRIREMGTHAELLSLAGIYARLYALQLRTGAHRSDVTPAAAG